MKKNDTIRGVTIVPLKVIEDERGKVMHIIRSDAEHFEAFGEAYFSIVNPGITKGWKYHKKMKQFFTVPVGHLRVIIYDDRGDSETQGKFQEIELSPKDYKLLIIPPKVWYALKCESKKTPALITNIATRPFEEGESIVIPLNSDKICYDFNL